jgi:molybdenum cofactor guanylyltransferase
MTGIILAGGQSRRLGTAKALLRLNEETFVEHAASLLHGRCHRIIVVADPALSLPPLADCTVLRDEQPGLGPLGGIVTALSASDDEWHLALACDVPLIRPALLHLIVSRQSDQTDAVIPHAAGRLQPLIATYSRRCLEPARQALLNGERAMLALLTRVKVTVIEEHDLREVDPELISFININTWQDYQSLLEDYQR